MIRRSKESEIMFACPLCFGTHWQVDNPVSCGPPPHPLLARNRLVWRGHRPTVKLGVELSQSLYLRQRWTYWLDMTCIIVRHSCII